MKRLQSNRRNFNEHYGIMENVILELAFDSNYGDYISKKLTMGLTSFPAFQMVFRRYATIVMGI